jgi:hypothetical protein
MFISRRFDKDWSDIAPCCPQTTQYVPYCAVNIKQFFYSLNILRNISLWSIDSILLCNMRYCTIILAKATKVDCDWNVMAQACARKRGLRGKPANGVGTQVMKREKQVTAGPASLPTTRRCAHFSCYSLTKLTPPADSNGLVLFSERRNLVSAHGPSCLKRSLQNKPNVLKILWKKFKPSVNLAKHKLMHYNKQKYNT